MKKLIVAGIVMMVAFTCVADNIDFSGISRDPTAPPTVTTPKVSKATVNTNESLNVQAILIAGDREAAIISGKIVKVGDMVQGMKVISITQQYVEFVDFDRKFKVPLYNSILKKVSAEVSTS